MTNCSGCREIVNFGEYGLMTEQEVVDIANKMEMFLSDQKLLETLHQKSLERAKIFQDKKILEEYYNIFNS